MFDFIKSRYDIIIFAVITVSGLMIKIIEEINYKKILKQSENIGMTKNKFFKQLKQKFETYYHSGNGLNNIEVFVDKQIYKIKICGCPWYSTNRLLMFWGIICSILGFLLGVYKYYIGQPLESVLVSVIVGNVCAIILAMLYFQTDMDYKRCILVANIRDYLENSLVNRLSKEDKREKREKKSENNTESVLDKNINFDKENLLNGDGSKLLEKLNELSKQKVKSNAAAVNENENQKNAEYEETRKVRRDNEKIINDILQEYFS